MGCTTFAHYMSAQPTSGPRSRRGGPHGSHISTSGHPALRRTRTRTGCPLDAIRCKCHVVGVRCAAPIGTNDIWRAIWLRWLDGSTSVEVGRRVGTSVKSRLAQPPRIVDVFDALRPSRYARAGLGAIFKPTTQARDTDGMARSNGRGQIARSPTDASQATLIVTCHPVL